MVQASWHVAAALAAGAAGSSAKVKHFPFFPASNTELSRSRTAAPQRFASSNNKTPPDATVSNNGPGYQQNAIFLKLLK